MGTYFHGGSEFQGDGLQTLILMNPSYVGYSNTQHHHQQQPQPPQATNFVFLNSPASAAAAHSLNPPISPHAPPTSSQHLVGVPVHAHGAVSTHDHPFFRPVHYNMHASIDSAAAREDTPHRQTLSLSLSSRHTNPGIASPPALRGEVQVSGGSPSVISGISNGVSVLVSSKYLKAVQELLEEVVSIGKVEREEFVKSAREPPVAGGGLCGGETSGKHGGELTPMDRQEVQMQKVKLVNLLDEVEQRYRQYHSQMQNVISWFEQSTGIGSAKTYTSLALQTISKQFRYLKDAITNQIRSASNALGEEEHDGCRSNEGSGLKFVDNQLKQQRTMQQLGMVQPNTWRPQRGLPERAVSVLRAWLFEHFLHPYPKDSDKVTLAKQTGLTRSQVSNWFINARVRLWKPMVEEMYLEETKEQERSKTEGTSTKKSKNKAENSNPISPDNPIPTPSPVRNTLIDITQGSPKKQRTSETLQSLIGAPEDFTGGFGSYPIGEITRFDGGHFPTGYPGNNGVSLTLGLPHCESLSMQGSHRGGFVSEQGIELGRRIEIGEGNEFVASDSHTRDVFAAQLVRDYVA